MCNFYQILLQAVLDNRMVDVPFSRPFYQWLLKEDATLSTRDQKEMDTLNDDIRELKQENKKAFAECMRLEAQVNKLENLLTNNLNRRRVCMT